MFYTTPRTLRPRSPSPCAQGEGRGEGFTAGWGQCRHRPSTGGDLMTDNRKRAADELDAVLDAVLQAIPPERRDEMRTLLRAARHKRPRKAVANLGHALTPDDDSGHDERTARPPEPPHAPLPPLTPEHAARIADDVIRTALHSAGAPPHAPLSL